jgi:nucleoid DNA-binding protein
MFAGLAIFAKLVEQCVFSKPKGIAMNKSELIEAVAERAELSKAAVNKAIDALTEVITAAITKGNPVALIGFGTFKSVLHAPAKIRRPVPCSRSPPSPCRSFLPALA